MEWCDRYSRRIEEKRLFENQDRRQANAQILGERGFEPWICSRDQTHRSNQTSCTGGSLRRLLVRRYKPLKIGPDGDQVRLRANRELPPRVRFCRRHEIT